LDEIGSFFGVDVKMPFGMLDSFDLDLGIFGKACEALEPRERPSPRPYPSIADCKGRDRLLAREGDDFSA
jgi:hypothetical protein